MILWVSPSFQIVLGLVLLLAAVTKLRDLAATKTTIEGFGFSRLAGFASGVVPSTEVILGLGLMSGFASRIVALGAVALLLVFSLVIGAAVRSGQDVECNCFGSFGRRAVGPWTLVRNGAFLAMAAVVAIFPSTHDMQIWLRARTTIIAQPAIASTIALLLIATIQLALSIVILRRTSASLKGESAPAVAPQDAAELIAGSTVPDVSISLDGSSLNLHEVIAKFETNLLVFVNARCRACHELVAWLHTISELVDGVQVMLMARTVALSGQGLPSSVTPYVYSGSEFPVALGAGTTPTAVVVSSDGRKLSAAVRGRDAIKSLLRHYVKSMKEGKYAS